MGIKSFKAITPGQRFKTVSTFEQVTKSEPEKKLTKGMKKTGGRNNLGSVTSRHRGGGNKRKYRDIDFKRIKRNIPARVAAIEYDPNRTARIALLYYVDGEKKYILAPDGLKVNDMVESGENVKLQPGNALPLEKIPVGVSVHNIEIRENKGGQIARSAGTAVQLMAKEGKWAMLKLPSGEVRKVPLKCYATLGQVSNTDHFNISIGKAGRSRWLGRRPHVRGVAMNPIDHPMGGGEGKSSGGRHPVSPWGQLAKGLKTRKKNKPSNVLIVKKRK
jgi:large subunit ribosomal protein L2